MIRSRRGTTKSSRYREPAGSQGEDPWNRADPWSEWDGAQDLTLVGRLGLVLGLAAGLVAQRRQGQRLCGSPRLARLGANYRLWKRAVKRWD